MVLLSPLKTHIPETEHLTVMAGSTSLPLGYGTLHTVHRSTKMACNFPKKKSQEYFQNKLAWLFGKKVSSLRQNKYRSPYLRDEETEPRRMI